MSPFRMLLLSNYSFVVSITFWVTHEQKLPITPETLLPIHSTLTAHRDSGFWAAMLIGFYSFIRKSNLVPKSAKDYNRSKTLLRKDIIVRQWD